MNNIIYLTLDGKECFARVTEVSHRKHSMFRVSLSDGYENIFFTDVETGEWIEEDLGYTDLAKSIGEKVQSFERKPIHVAKMLTWHTQVIDNVLLNFGFFNFMKDKYKMYEIYSANRKYLYTLVEMENDEWQILGNNSSALKYIDPIFIQKLIQILPLYWLNER